MESTRNGKGTPSTTDRFHQFACAVANWVGTPCAFVISGLLLVGWAVSGPFFGFSETWQLVINTATTIVTFLMVFLIQNTQNRDARAFNLKLDELIRSTKKARNALIDLENMTDEELAEIQKQFERIGRRANGHKHNGAGNDASKQAVQVRSGRI
jgi:low affinity Fe/Cu permease